MNFADWIIIVMFVGFIVYDWVMPSESVRKMHEQDEIAKRVVERLR